MVKSIDISIFFSALLICIMSTAATAAEIDTIRIASRLDPNAIIITEVDVVFVYDQSIVDTFPATKSAWYSGKFMFTRRVGDAVDVINTFIPQGFDYLDLILPERKDQALKVYVFAQHDDSNRPALEISEADTVLIEIDPFGVVISD